MLPKSLRAEVTSARSRRDGDHTREHEHRDRGCRHDGCAHDARTHDIGLVHRLASLVVNLLGAAWLERRAALRSALCAPQALGVSR